MRLFNWEYRPTVVFGERSSDPAFFINDGETAWEPCDAIEVFDSGHEVSLATFAALFPTVKSFPPTPR